MATLPSEHLVDKGYTDRVLVASRQEHGVEIIGPVAQDPSWQSREKAGFNKSMFLVDWKARVVTCPAAREAYRDCRTPIRPTARFFKHVSRGTIALHVAPVFNAHDQSRSRASSACKLGNTMRALQSMRVRQVTAEFRLAYAARAGIESTHAQAVKRSGLRRTRCRGLSKTHLQHVIPAAAINLLRIAAWTAGTPLAKTRRSHFAALQFHAACIRHQY